jgi:hypothetical protein
MGRRDEPDSVKPSPINIAVRILRLALGVALILVAIDHARP